MHRPKLSSSPFALNWVSSTPQVLLVRQTNGHCACLLPSWLIGFSILPLRSTCLGFVHSILNRGFQTPLPTVSAFRGWSVASSACQGSSSSSRLPITDDLMLLIWRSLDLCLPDHLMFWAACSLGYFGFLRASEFTVPNLASSSPSLHLGVQDIAVDSLSTPLCMHVKIKGSKTDLFRKGAYIHIGRGQPPLCAVHSVRSYLADSSDRSGPLFMGPPFHTLC